MQKTTIRTDAGDRLPSIREIQERLGVSRTFVRSLQDAGELPLHKIGKLIAEFMSIDPPHPKTSGWYHRPSRKSFLMSQNLIPEARLVGGSTLPQAAVRKSSVRDVDG